MKNRILAALFSIAFLACFSAQAQELKCNRAIKKDMKAHKKDCKIRKKMFHDRPYKAAKKYYKADNKEQRVEEKEYKHKLTPHHDGPES